MPRRIATARRRNRRLILLAACGVAVATIWLATPGLPPLKLPVVDFITYWSAARVYLAGGNPYDPAQLAPLQQVFGPVMLEMTTFWYMPWTLPFLAPLGWLAYSAAFLLCFGMSLACVLVGLGLVANRYGGHARSSWLSLGLALAFAPLAIALVLGQITPLLLFGLAGFLYCETRRRDLLAGCALAAVSVKPQLLYLFWVALLFWLIGTRRWRVVLGALLPVAAGCLVVALTNPGALLGYLRSVNYAAYSIPPTLISALGLPKWVSLAVPCLAVLWFAWYWRKHGASWQWQRELPLLVILSLATTPVVWTADLVLLLLPLVAIMARLSARSRALAAALGFYLLLNAAMWYVVLNMPGHHERLAWAPLAFLLFFLAARHVAELRMRSPAALVLNGPDVAAAAPEAPSR